MGEKFVVRCIQQFFDSERNRLFYPGNEAEIDSLEPAAKYFEGWPDGTKVYTKEKGKEGTRIVTGKTKEEFEKLEKRGPGNPAFIRKKLERLATETETEAEK